MRHTRSGRQLSGYQSASRCWLQDSCQHDQGQIPRGDPQDFQHPEWLYTRGRRTDSSGEWMGWGVSVTLEPFWTPFSAPHVNVNFNRISFADRCYLVVDTVWSFNDLNNVGLRFVEIINPVLCTRGHYCCYRHTNTMASFLQTRSLLILPAYGFCGLDVELFSLSLLTYFKCASDTLGFKPN